MGKSILLVVLLITLAVASAAEYGDEKTQNGPCGKFTTERMLTHVLRHCEKAARDVQAPVSAQCCQALQNVSGDCLYTVFVSGAFSQVGINPYIAMTIPARCHY